MQGIHILGTSMVVPANDPDQFVSALIDVDKNTASSTPWQFTFLLLPPGGASETFDRVGGCVHKVIRWAFETQGLYNPFGKITNAPGAPPPVDVYINDLRPTWDNCAQSGNIDYGPVATIRSRLSGLALRLKPVRRPPGRRPLMPSTYRVTTLRCESQSRHPSRHGVTVQIWWCTWPALTNPPLWNDGAAGWNSSAISAPQNVNAGGGEVNFNFVEALPATRYIILAEASCGDV